MPLKIILKKALRKLGYDIHKITKSNEDNSFIPFIHNFDLRGQKFSFWISNLDAVSWYPDDWSEAGELSELLRLACPGDRVLEFGSHHGFTALLLANAVKDSGFVLGVEPFPENVIVAQSQICLNNLGSRMQILHRAGASDKDNEILISRVHNSSVLMNKTKESIVVTTVTGDQLDNQHGPFTFIKLDVEGFEERILQGCKTILERKPKIALELHLDELVKFGSSKEKIFELVKIDEYEGNMIIRPDYKNIKPFNISDLPETGIVNLFLAPKV